MNRTHAQLVKRLSLVAMALGVSIGLAGCIQSATPLPNSTPSAGASATTRPTTSATPTATPTSPKFAESCTTLLTPAQVYAYNSNFVADPNYVPKPATVPAAVAAQGGQTCGWINETSGAKIEVAVTALDPSQWEAARTAASGGTPIDANGDKGFFAVKNGLGSAQLFFGSIWLDVSSTDFATAADAEALYPIVDHNQRTAGG